MKVTVGTGIRRYLLTASALVGMVLTGQLVFLVVWSTAKYDTFQLSVDFAIFHQAWHQIAHADLNPYLTVAGHPYWRDQFGLFLWPVAVLWFLYPHAVDLLWAQDIATVAAEAVALWWLWEVVSSHATRTVSRLALGSTLVLFVVDPWVYLTDNQDFHLETIATLFLVLAARDMWARRRRTWLWAGLLLSTGTLGGAYLVGLGLSAVLLVARGPHRRAGAAAVLAGTGWMALVVAVHASLGTGIDQYAYLASSPRPPTRGISALWAVLTGMVRHPSRPLRMLWHRLPMLRDNLIPTGIAGALWPWALGVTAALYAINGLNEHPSFAAVSFQNFPVYVLATVGTGVLVGRLGSRLGLPVCAAVGATAVLGSGAFFGLHRQEITTYRIAAGTARTLDSALAQAAPGDEVVTSFGVIGRFAGRRWAYVLNGPHERIPLHARRVEFVLAPSVGNQFLPLAEVDQQIALVRDRLRARPLAVGQGVFTYRWQPPAGMKSVTLP